MARETISLTVNGTPVDVNEDRNTPLLYILRNELGLKGTRFGCGEGLCGACTVLLEDQAIYACDTPLWAVENRAVTTVEGLQTRGEPGTVQSALLKARAGQCGYCLSGIVMRLESALRKAPLPSREAIVGELSLNLCRCGTHPRVLRALDDLLEDRAEKKSP